MPDTRTRNKEKSMRKKFVRSSGVSNGHLENSAEKLARLRKGAERNAKEESSVGLPDSSKRLRRDSKGRLPPKLKSTIRDAILNELDKREISRYQLWKLARAHCATIPESAVYEFLRGQRQ